MAAIRKRAVVGVACCVLSSIAGAQNATQFATSQMTFHGKSLPLREIVPSSRQRVRPQLRVLRIPIEKSAVVSEQRDPVEQRIATAAIATTPDKNFEGLGAGFVGFDMVAMPSDANLSVGTAQVVQWVNTSLVIFDKNTGAAVLGPLPGNTVFSKLSNKCATTNDGEPTVLFDKKARRWILTQLAVTDGNGQLAAPFFQCIAVSRTADATGVYNLYSVQFSNLNDYGKMGVWPDAFYMSFNMFHPTAGSFLGAAVCAFQRSAMLAGTAAKHVCFQLSSSFGGLLPSDLDGATNPPAGTPNSFLNFGSNKLNVWKFKVNFTTPSLSTLTGPTTIAVAPFTPACGSGGLCIPQPEINRPLESLSDRLMYRLAYRNVNGGTLVANHSVDTGQAKSSGIRWYELRNTNTRATVRQQGTYNPSFDVDRWMGSIAMDKVGDIAVGYSVSGHFFPPSIFYAGRVPTDPLGTLQDETSAIWGSGSQSFRAWGSYSSMSIDPSNDCTFWYTAQYILHSGVFNWHTRIVSFKFPSCQ